MSPLAAAADEAPCRLRVAELEAGRGGGVGLHGVRAPLTPEEYAAANETEFLRPGPLLDAALAVVAELKRGGRFRHGDSISEPPDVMSLGGPWYMARSGQGPEMYRCQDQAALLRRGDRFVSVPAPPFEMDACQWGGISAHFEVVEGRLRALAVRDHFWGDDGASERVSVFDGATWSAPCRIEARWSSRFSVGAAFGPEASRLERKVVDRLRGYDRARVVLIDEAGAAEVETLLKAGEAVGVKGALLTFGRESEAPNEVDVIDWTLDTVPAEGVRYRMAFGQAGFAIRSWRTDAYIANLWRMDGERRIPVGGWWLTLERVALIDAKIVPDRDGF